ncbi:Group XV phospholipase [Quillaja saponaria]|uniref:Group XV phospholipase n=1 Tax=Quillaja saponaria TaxID=32244 RepID=A0AAD7LSC2_QUISA|nr:Group XV phospholipase [Quillaja saponaria]
MGLNVAEKNGDLETQKILKPWLVAYLLSLCISLVGGFVIGWWMYKYHPTNSELWMVPFGLILLVTPVFIWFSVIISDLFTSKNEDDKAYGKSQRVRPVDDSVCDPER